MAESVREYTFKKWPVSKNFVYDINRETGQVENLRCTVCSNQWTQIQAEARRRNLKGVVLNSVKQYVQGVQFIHRGNVHRHCKPGSLHEFAENLSKSCASAEDISTATIQPKIEAVLPSTTQQVFNQHNNLRTCYTKKKRKTYNKPDKHNQSCESRKAFFEALDAFLKEHVNNSAKTTTTTTENNGNNDSHDDDTSGEKGSEDVDNVSSATGKRRRIDKEKSLYAALLTLKETSCTCSSPAAKPVQDETPDDLFGRLIAQQISAIPECFKKEVLKLKLQQLIVETKYEAELSCTVTTPAESLTVLNPCSPKTEQAETQEIIPNLYHPSNMSNEQHQEALGS